MAHDQHEPLKPEQLAATLSELLTWAHENAPKPEPKIRLRLREHLGGDPADMPVVSKPLEGYERVNFQVALDALLEAEDRNAELIGFSSSMGGFQIGLAQLGMPVSPYAPIPDPGPAEFETVEVGDRSISCVASGLWLIQDGERSLALLLSRKEMGMHEAGLSLEVMAAGQEEADGFMAELGRMMDERNVYRGRVVVIEGSLYGGLGLSVRRLPAVGRDQIVLPEGVLERVERHTERFAEHADQLREAGRHLRRGVLLHGPPGTGKTLTAMYLSALMPGRTTLLLTGEALSLIGPATEIARRLAPAMVVLEDVDLVALEREHYENTGALLFQLLNAMDGLDDDADIIFLLTTNRPAALEPALAARPGRVDLAVELPLPDDEGRERLLGLYAKGLELDLKDPDAIVRATEGTSPAFIRELLRRAALLAAEEGNGMRVGDTQVLAAIDELRQAGQELTQTLLGGGEEIDP